MKKRWILAALVFFSMIPALAAADCVDLGVYTAWYIEDPHTIVFLRETRLIARVTVPDCFIEPTSDIRLINNLMCDDDMITIDGEVYRVMRVSVIF